MPSRRSSSSPDRLAPLALLACLAGASPAHAQARRPAVTVDVRIDGPLYRSQLGDDACTARCATLRASLVDSVRAAFDRSFGFLEWRALPAAAPDTLVVAWVNSETQAGKLALTLRGQHARRRTRPAQLPFETFSAIASRPAADWQRVDVVRAAWLARLRTILARPSEAQGIVSNVLWQVPIQSPVTLATAPDVVVGVGPGTLRADPARSPVFVVRMYVVDPADVAPTSARQDTTEMSLAGCSRTVDGRNYRCRVDLLVYPERTPPDTIRTVADLATLARRARQQPVTLHLWTFFPVDPADDAPLRRPEE